MRMMCSLVRWNPRDLVRTKTHKSDLTRDYKKMLELMFSVWSILTLGGNCWGGINNVTLMVLLRLGRHIGRSGYWPPL